jgi:hypothetical protein
LLRNSVSIKNDDDSVDQQLSRLPHTFDNVS